MKTIVKFILISVVLCNVAKAQNIYALDTAYTAPKIKDSLVKKYKDGMVKWLKSLMTLATPIRYKMVNDILKNAEFDKMYTEYHSVNRKLLIIPLKKSYFSQHISKSEPMPFQNLFFRLDENNKLAEVGDIMLISPADKSLKELPKNTFQNFYSQSRTLDGTYTFITIFAADRKVWSMDIKNQERAEARFWKDKKANNNFSNSREWHLQTDIIENGRIIKTTTKNLGVSNTVNPPQFKGDKRPVETQ